MTTPRDLFDQGKYAAATALACVEISEAMQRTTTYTIGKCGVPTHMPGDGITCSKYLGHYGAHWGTNRTGSVSTGWGGL